MAQDRISELPDPILHHILSFLPSTKQAIRTEILSKRWRKQWPHVPALIFDSSPTIPKNFLNILDKTLTLHKNPKINTFHLNYNGHRGTFRKYPQVEEKIRFATAKHVKDLSLSCSGYTDRYLVPEFLFDNDLLVKLRFGNCELVPNGKVNWVSLRELKLKDCMLTERAMDYVFSGCPLLELLELADCAVSDNIVEEDVYDDCRFHNLVIASKSLRKLVLEDIKIDVLEISCPNLEELSMKRLSNDDPKLFDEAIENALSNCSLLETLMLIEFHSLSRPVVASPSLRRLVMSNIRCVHGFEMSCQKLEELEIWGIMNMMTVSLRDVPSSLRASLCLVIRDPSSTRETQRSFVEGILQQVQHVKELTIGNWIIEILTALEVGSLFSPMLNIKCLFLDRPYWYMQLSRIASLFRNLPVLETLVVKMFLVEQYNDDVPNLDGFGENYWSSNVIGFNCLESHLKTVKIYGIPQDESKPMRMLNFIRFLLNNARVLEKMTVALTANPHTDYVFKESQELLGFTRCSKHANVELISECSSPV